MFSIDDLEKMDWFTVTNKTKRSIEIKSVPTGHYWRLIMRNGYFDMTHRHKKEDNEHAQTSCETLYDCVLYIIGHDEFQLRGRKVISREEELRQGSYFFDVIDKFGLV